MACGCIPILTDIPSYRMMTDEGRIGPLWSPGNPSALVAAMQQAFALPLEEQSQKVRRFFDDHLSYPAIAETMIRCYCELLAKSAEKFL